MHRVVVTRQAPDAMLGLPGCLCVIGSSREKGHETADIPVHVFGPPGTGDYLSTMYEVRRLASPCKTYAGSANTPLDVLPAGFHV
jgi:ribonuclease Z